MISSETCRWTIRSETPDDIPVVRAINLAAFPTPMEADATDRLRADPTVRIPGLTLLATDVDGTVTGYVMYTRCHVDDHPVLALAVCAVLPAHQRRGAGSAAIRAGLDAARNLGEHLVLVIGHPGYYPRFGFIPASRWNIHPPFEAPDDAMMALPLDRAPIPSGTIHYPTALLPPA
jgi:predicted N-acetyltransferase YhbS